MISRKKEKTLLIVALLCIFTFLIYSNSSTRYTQRIKNNTNVSNEYQNCLRQRRHQKTHEVFKTDLKTQVPLLVLFTTWRDDQGLNPVNNITLHNWSRLKPFVQLVFFSTTGKHDEFILKQGWKVLRISKSSPQGIPILKYMYMDVVCKFEALFYAYSNGDILYDSSITETLTFASSLNSRRPVLIIGKRTNVFNVTEKEVNTSPLRITAERGDLFEVAAMDYFITNAEFPWETIPEVVVGRNGYDNWLIINAKQLDFLVIDATETILAVHQTTASGNFAGSKSTNPNYNLDLLKREFTEVPYDEGSSTCALYATVRRDLSKHIEMIERYMLPLICTFSFRFFKLFLLGAILLGLYAIRLVCIRHV